MKKERTNDEYAAMANTHIKVLMAKYSKAELARMVAVEHMTKMVTEDIQAIHQPMLDAKKKEQEELVARIQKLRESNKKEAAEREADLRSKLRDAPKQLAMRGAQARAEKELGLLKKKFKFLSEQHDISHTEGLARRLDREFGIKGRQPREDEAASRASKDAVRDWNRFRSASKTEETSGTTAQKEPKEP